MRKIETVLQDIGLNEKEIAIYLAALSLQDCSLLKLAEKAGIKRTTTYAVVKTLAEKGLLGTYRAKSGIRVRSQSPERLVTQVEQRLRDTQSILPSLKQLNDDSVFTPHVTFYQGAKGYHAVLEDALQKHSSMVYFIGTGREISNIITEEFIYDHFIPARIQKKIHAKELIFRKDLPMFTERDQHRDLREIRTLPDEFSFMAAKAIYTNKVAIFSSTKEAVCMLIESDAIADMERKIFDYLWEHAASFPPRI